jgi:hypothetical protein
MLATEIIPPGSDTFIGLLTFEGKDNLELARQAIHKNE